MAMIEDANTPDDLLLRKLLSALDIAASNRYVSLGDSRLANIYITYLSYRVQQDLYQVCRENEILLDLSWDEFVLVMRMNKPAREASAVVLRTVLSDFCKRKLFRFDIVRPGFPDDIEQADDRLHCANLFTEDEGTALIGGALCLAEIAQYSLLLQQRKCDFWQSYLDELLQKGELWNQLYTAFQDALIWLDFKPAWRSEKLEALVNQSGSPEM